MAKTKIFLASSAELIDDRREFEIFINRKNKDWHAHGAFIELIVWEDFLDAKVEWPTMRAKGVRPARFASDSRIRTKAAAPSEIDDELAGVTAPSRLNAGFSLAIFETSHFIGVSSSAIISSPLRVVTVTGAISAAKTPAVTACCARVTDCMAKASISSRVKPYFSTHSSAKAPISLPGS